MFEEAGEVLENMLKCSFPLSLLLFLVLMCPLRADAAHEFSVYRMQQYDLQGQNYGKNSIIHLKVCVNSMILTLFTLFFNVCDLLISRTALTMRVHSVYRSITIVLTHTTERVIC